MQLTSFQRILKLRKAPLGRFVQQSHFSPCQNQLIYIDLIEHFPSVKCCTSVQKNWYHWNYVSCVNCEEYWNYKCILKGLTFQPSNISLGVEILCLTPDQKVTGLVSILVLKCPWVTHLERHQCVTLTVKLVGPQSRCKIIINTRRLHSGAKLSNILHRVIGLHYVS